MIRSKKEQQPGFVTVFIDLYHNHLTWESLSWAQGAAWPAFG